MQLKCQNKCVPELWLWTDDCINVVNGYTHLEGTRKLFVYVYSFMKYRKGHSSSLYVGLLQTRWLDDQIGRGPGEGIWDWKLNDWICHECHKVEWRMVCGSIAVPTYVEIKAICNRRDLWQTTGDKSACQTGLGWESCFVYFMTVFSNPPELGPTWFIINSEISLWGIIGTNGNV